MDVMLNCPSGCETIHHRLKCGTNVFILPKDRNIKVGAVSVGFGSADREFYFDGKSYVIPPGTAHFLEHEMFNRPDGDISEKFAELGAEVNAFTDTEKTVYYFKTAGNFSHGVHFFLKVYAQREKVYAVAGLLCQQSANGSGYIQGGLFSQRGAGFKAEQRKRGVSVLRRHVGLCLCQ